MSKSHWVTIPRPTPRAAVRLFCIPYAGGSAVAFRQWPNSFSPEIEVCAIQLPGRGNRLGESHFTSMPELTGALADALRPFLDKPFAVFGHDLGALVGFELTRHLRKHTDVQPRHLFVGGRRAPQAPSNNPPVYNLPEPEFIAALREMHGTPAEVLEHPELMQLMLPLLRADFELAETYVYRYAPPLGVPVSAYGGLQDRDPTREELEGWRNQTTGRFDLRMFPGDHFFLHSAQAALTNVVNRELSATN
jgi:medium-chain acyl-[acyl-carrier-protein] hydrolase